MPPIKRWFPVSHDINGDPEVWELTEKFGDRALRVWLDMLSWGDRNDGILKGKAQWLVGSLMRVYHRGNPKWFRRDSETLLSMLRWMSEKHWIAFRSASDRFQRDVREGSEDALVILNHAKYHRSREHVRLPSEPSEPSGPKHTKPEKHKNASLPPPPAEAIECVQLLSDLIFDNYPTRTAPNEAQLIAWARDAERCNRIDLHSWAEIRELIEWSQKDSFWKSNILSMGKLREKWNQLTAKKEGQNGEANNHVREPKGFDSVRGFLKLHANDKK